MKISRRTFLGQSAITAVGLGFASPLVAAARAGGRGARGAGSRRTIVVVNLQGGNDGLNTLVPLRQFDRYRSIRPTLALKRDRLVGLPGAEDFALNPFMTALGDLYAAGRVAVVAGFGPPADAVGLFDHFQAQSMVQTGNVEEPIGPTGWIGRYLDVAGEGLVSPAVNLGGGYLVLTGDAALRAAGTRREVLTIRAVDDIGVTLPEDSAALHAAFERIQRVPARAGAAEYGRRVREQLVDQAAIIHDRTAGYEPAVDYPTENENPVAFSLGQCARLVAADIGVRALTVGYLGFDTHAAQNDGAEGNEPGNHDFLLESVSDGLGLFYRDLDAHGLGGDVVTLVMSEFGRRPAENAARGTDHGLGSVAFVVGGGVRGGVYGEYPSLAPERLVLDGNLDATTDLRSVFATILAGFFDQDPAPVLGVDPPRLGFF
jgi:uncharacterized protein (DUF1501 family)